MDRLARVLARGAAVVTARPVLGIVACTRTVGVEPAQAVMNRYVTAAMRHADAAALLIPAVPELMRADEVVARLDGVLLTGSPSNVDAARYGEGDADDADGPFDRPRDAMTADLIAAMTAAGKPVFGVCRGFQEIVVAFGGKLRRDTSRSPGLLRHHAPDGVPFDAMFAHEHAVSLIPGGILHGAYGRPGLQVNSVHYQGAGRLGGGLAVEAVAPDGLVEAVSRQTGGAPVLAVQWHPEWHTGDNPDSQTFFHLLGRALRGETLRGHLP